jgi:peptidoglycan/LPS O-acetylase OafA/YrhL
MHATPVTLPPAGPSQAPAESERAETSAGTPPGPDRLYEIDLLRFLAASAVLLYHWSFAGAAREPWTVMQYPLISPFARYGYLGVDLFFIISGFVVLMSAMGSTPKRFFISRVVRLYPAFWVCCLLTFTVAMLIGAPRFHVPAKHLLVNLTMMQGFLDVPHVDGVYWSLAVELKFYFLILGLLLVRIRVSKPYSQAGPGGAKMAACKSSLQCDITRVQRNVLAFLLPIRRATKASERSRASRA